MPTQTEIEEKLNASEADMATGRVTALAPVLSRMRETAERIRREKSLKQQALPTSA